MDIASLDHQDALNCLELIEGALKVKSPEELEHFWPKLQKYCGLTGVIFGSSISDSNNDLLSSYLSTFGIPDGWLNHYKDKRWITNDPVVLASIALDRPISWWDAIDWIEAQGIHQAVMEEFKAVAIAHGLKFGYALGVRSNVITQTLSVTSLTTGLNEMDARQETLVCCLLPHLNQILIRPGFNDLPQLSEREMEVMKWLKHGKSNWDISVILGISERTVKFHMANIFAKLDVTNRSYAIAKAMKLGIVDLD